MRIPKRFLSLVVSILLIFAAVFTVNAQGKTYYIEELGLSLEIPAYMTASTRATNPNMTEGTYLEVASAAPDLDIRVHMIKNAKTEEFFNLSLLSSSVLDEYKESLLSNSQFSDCTEGTYGGVLFLDFTTYGEEGNVSVYGRQSVTIVNGMSITIASTSDGDALSSEELEIIRDVVSSIKFDEILSNTPGVTFWQVFIPILIVILVLVLGFFVFSYFMAKKSKEEKKRRRKEQERKADYDVLKRAEKKAHIPQNSEGLGGYKTSDAFFEDAFSEQGNNNADANSSASQKQAPAASNVVKESKQAVKSTGYFFKNLKRELSKSKKNIKKSKRTKKPQDRKPRDYDVFND